MSGKGNDGHDLSGAGEPLRNLVNDAPVAVVVSVEGTFVYLNPAAVRLFGGSSPDELIGRGMTEFIHPDQQGQERERVAAALASGLPAPPNVERLVRLDGSEFVGEVLGVPTTFEGRPAVQAVIHDITEQRRVEESLRNSKRHYEELYRLLRLMCDNVPDLVWAKDMEQRYTFVNRAMCDKLLGAVDTDEPIGRDNMFFAERERAAHPERPDWHTFGELCLGTDTIVMDSGRAGRFDVYGNVKGEFLFLDVCKAPFRDERGDMIGTVGCGRDVTQVKRLEEDRLRAEEEVRRLNEQLEQLVAERTGELQQANRDLTSFCYAISHELRSPIARLQGFSEMLTESLPGNVEQAVFFAQRIAAASVQLKQVTDAVLHLSRVSRAELSLRTVDLSMMAGAVVGMLRGSIAGRQVEIVIEPGLSATGDPDLLKLCLENLLGNAFKYSSRQPVARVEFGRDPATGAFFVRDNGAGFDMTYADKLFMPFQRLHCQDEFPGTGIGLATVQRVVERHGGRVWAEGAVDGGAVFYFSLGTAKE
jgi:PAS domain S-box-containing protein